MRPRPYISFSQMTTFEQSKERFIAQYVYGEKQRVSRNMAYGSKMAEGLEADEATGDPLLDLVMARIPKLEIRDFPVIDPKGTTVTFSRNGNNTPVTVPTLKNGKDPIPLMAVPDTATKDYRSFKEYKTSVRKWTQRMADESGQITFYATAIWIGYGFIPTDIELVNAQVEYDEEGRLQPTGDILCFPTKRTMVDVIKMTKRIKTAWSEILEVCQKELL